MTYPWPTDTQGLQVGDVLVDLRYRRIVTRDGGVELQQRVFELLLTLMAEPNKLFMRSELFDRLWSGLVVDDANLSQSIWLLRKALGESRREWIRTVAKRGYVFQPPGSVQWFTFMPMFGDDGGVVHSGAVAPVATEAGSDTGANTSIIGGCQSTTDHTDHVQLAPLDESLRIPEPRAAKDPVRRRAQLGRWLTLGILVVACITASVWLLPSRTAAATTIALVPVQGEAGSDVPWATALLQDWLGWKLGQLSGVNLVSGETLAEGADRPVVLMLSATRTADGKKVIVRALMRRGTRETVWQESAAPASVPALVDRISIRAMSSLVPGREQPWPALKIDAASAEKFLPMSSAFKRSDWQTVERLAPEVLSHAPRFGLAYFQLGFAQYQLGESARATRQLEIASKLLTPLPTEAGASLQALKLEVDPRRARDAERALKSLVVAYPSHAVYVDRYISLLITTGQFDKAIAEIALNSRSSTDTLARRFRREMQYADVYYGLGQIRRSLRHARAAAALVEGDSEVSRGRRAQAALVEARARADVSPRDGEVAYRNASKLLALSGSEGPARYADIMADVYASHLSRGNDALVAALARARQAGEINLQADILVGLANVSSNDAERIDWLQQALQIAQEMGNLNLQGGIESALAMDDLVHLRLTDARARAVQLQALSLEGIPGVSVNNTLSHVLELEGRLSEARAASWAAVRAVPTEDGELHGDHALAYCAVMRLDTYLGAPQRDSSLAKSCGRAVDGPSKFEAALAQASVSFLVDEPQMAANYIKRAQELLRRDQATATPGTPGERASVRLRLGALLLRAGDSDGAVTLVTQVQADSKTHDLLPLQSALLAVLQAEIDAARGDWSDSRQWSWQARMKLPAEARGLLDRLDLLQIADDQRHGKAEQAINLAKELYRQAGLRHDLRTQQLVLSLVPSTTSLGLASETAKLASEGRTLTPGANMKWLGAIDRGVSPAVKVPAATKAKEN